VHEINIFALFWNAGLMVKFVMLLLLGFSVYSWFVIFQKHLLYRQVRKESEEFLDVFWKCKNLAEALEFSETTPICPEANIFRMGYKEQQKLIKSKIQKEKGSDDDTFEMRIAWMDNLKRTLRKAENIELNRLAKSLSFLATTGSATPFIGLFGTVWGIMTSFHEIGLKGSASLAVVAPGVSEALVVTAAGLAVAIPAVVSYNYYSSILAGVEDKMHSFSVDFLNLVERDLISRI